MGLQTNKRLLIYENDILKKMKDLVLACKNVFVSI